MQQKRRCEACGWNLHGQDDDTGCGLCLLIEHERKYEDAGRPHYRYFDAYLSTPDAVPAYNFCNQPEVKSALPEVKESIDRFRDSEFELMRFLFTKALRWDVSPFTICGAAFFVPWFRPLDLDKDLTKEGCLSESKQFRRRCRAVLLHQLELSRPEYTSAERASEVNLEFPEDEPIVPSAARKARQRRRARPAAVIEFDDLGIRHCKV